MGAGAFYAQELRIQSLHTAQSAARDAQFKAAIDAIHGKREAEDRAVAADKVERNRLKADVAANRKALAALASRSATDAQQTAADAKAAADLGTDLGKVQAMAAALRPPVRIVVRTSQ